MKKFNHYECAFEAYIHHLGLPCVATREHHRALSEENPELTIKTFDFIVSSRKLCMPTSWLEQPKMDYVRYFQNASPYAPMVTAFGKIRNNPAPKMNGNKEENSQKVEKIVLEPSALSWLVDIKGRKFPSGQKSPQYWRNWTSSDDLISLSRWENYFGLGFHGLFVFVYDVCGERTPLDANSLFEYNGRRYAFFGMPLLIYRDYCRQLSAQWQTVTMPVAEFRKFAVPLDEFWGHKYSV